MRSWVLCLFLVYPAVAPARGSLAETIERIRPSVVVLNVERKVNWGRRSTLGVGIVVDRDGRIVTAEHVVHGADSITVTHADGSALGEATVLAGSKERDLALVRVRTKRALEPLGAPVSDRLRVGDSVAALGHPFGYLYTVTRGIVSALDRSLNVESVTHTKLIQLDASINTGNSGGPMITPAGRWVGMVIALRENSQGIGFAVPGEVIAAFLKQYGDR